MRRAIATLALALGAAGCLGGNGPNDTLDGPSPCEQLQECLCDPRRTTDVAGCRLEIDALAGTSDGLAICRHQLTQRCGQPVEVGPTGLAPPGEAPGGE